MNLSKFLFKIFIILTFILRVMALTLPITWVIVNAKEGGWRYGFTFIQNNFEVALFVSFAISFLVTMYHAVKFDEIEGAPDQNYMKTSQKVRTSGSMNLNTLEQKMISNTRRFRKVKQQDDKITAERKVHFFPADSIQVTLNEGIFEVKSSPFVRWWFIDFGRNYKNVKEIAQFIKQIK